MPLPDHVLPKQEATTAVTKVDDGDINKIPSLSVSLSDFHVTRRLGDGSYSEVVLAINKQTGAKYALKIIVKSHIIRYGAVEAIQRERRLLEKLAGVPGIVRLWFTFQDASSLYMAFEYCSYGDLYEQIQNHGAFDAERVKIYAAELVEVLATLRDFRILHQDLKPENVLLGEDGHLRLADFGSARLLEAETPSIDEKCGNNQPHAGRSAPMAGTADYVSPEAIQGNALGFEADLWSLGCIIYHMFASKPPFRAATEYLTFQEIISGRYTPLAKDTTPIEARDLVKRLLNVNPIERIGCRSVDELRNHPFFEGIDWKGLWKSTPPEPVVVKENDDDFDWELQSMK